jgi:RND superfamily putative drug exporter
VSARRGDARAGFGQVLYSRRKLVVVAWVIIVVVGGASASQVSDRLDTDWRGSDRHESVRVQERLEAAGLGGSEIAALVEGGVRRDAINNEVRRAADEIRAYPGVATVADYPTTGLADLVATDGEAQVIVVSVAPNLASTEQKELAEQVELRLRAIESDSEVLVGGSLVVGAEFREAAEKDLHRGESIALPIALMAMVVIFGGLLAAGLPLFVAVGSVVATMSVLLTASQFTSLSIFALNVVTMLGIGLGIDYGLLVVSRFREERAVGFGIEDAVCRTVTAAGRTVAFSGLTVAVALAGLFVFDEPLFRSFGIAGIGVVVVSVACATTLLPALLAIAGRHIKPARVRDADRGVFRVIAMFVQRRALPIAVVTALALAALAVPFGSARFEMGDARSLPRSAESREVALGLAARFPSRGADPITVIAEVDATAPEFESYLSQLRRLPAAAEVMLRPGAPHGAVIVDVVPTGSSQGPAAQRLVRDIRALSPGFQTDVGGVAAQLVDFKSSIVDRLPYALAIIVIATFVLLFLMTGSVAVPLKAILMNVLSLGASFGALVWVFQEGHLSGLLGFEPTGAVDMFMPVLIFIFAFGLSMDYEVFLLSRIKEVHIEVRDNDIAVAVGLQRTGRVITSAAFLIVVVFAGFAMGEVLSVKQLGFGLAVAVIVDATVVRSLLVPATMKLLGEWNWWAPAPLRRFHARFGLREQAANEPPIPQRQMAA